MSAAISYGEILLAEKRRRRKTGAEILILLFLVCVAARYSGLLDWKRISEGAPDFFALASEGFPPNFKNWQSWLRPLVDTLSMSIAGTALAVFFSVPLAFLAARSSTPNRFVFHLARLILNSLRAVPELIMGIVFVAAVGFGALPGVLALGFHSIGMVGKFFAEAIEHADARPAEAALAAGASPLQVLQYAVLPQVLPQMADVALYRWEYNFRASTVLGAVGAGGIGFELIGSLRIMRYDEVGALILVILVMVTLVDATGSFLRRKFL